mmetsp:Transcript_10143/g.24146  ORF Transcript_10143/g.24146 Transcript_10143/m.24146 type:complete len:122 (+) Transcript_10143:53-418(+)
MPRNPRYPAAPVEQIVFPKGVPFVQYDEGASATSPPEAADFSAKECSTALARLSGGDSVGTEVHAGRCLSHYTRTSAADWTALRSSLGPSGTDFGALGGKDSRIDALKLNAASSTWSNWGL